MRRRRRTEGERKTGVYLSKILSGGRNAEIRAVFGITIQAVANAVRSVEKRLEEDNKFGSEVMGLKGIAATVK